MNQLLQAMNRPDEGQVLYTGITLQSRYQQRKYIYWLVYATVKKEKKKKNFKKNMPTDALKHSPHFLKKKKKRKEIHIFK